MSIEHVICNGYLEADKQREIDDFNLRLEASLDDANFIVDGEKASSTVGISKTSSTTN